MSTILKACVLRGRHQGEIVRISNVSTDELGKKSAACILTSGQRANIPVTDLEVIKEETPPQTEKKFAKTSSMPFISGSTSSRTMIHSKNMARPKQEIKSPIHSQKITIAVCESCGQDYNQEERKGMPGKITECENCGHETWKENPKNI